MKKRLFTPGPTPVPEPVLLRMAEPLIHHRNAEFETVMARVNQRLRYLFQTEQPVYTLTASGTGALEALVQNLLSPGDTALFVNGGKFGERWGQLYQAYGVHAVEIQTPWGVPPTVEDVIRMLRAHPEASAIGLTHSETSTGTATDVRAIAAAVHAEREDVLVLVDGITSVGAHELHMDAWGLDGVVTGSQKGLMVPPGLAFVALSKRAERVAEQTTNGRFYFDLRLSRETYEDDSTPWTPAITLVLGLDTALAMIEAEGLESIWSRHRRLATAARAGCQALGLRLFSDAPSFAVTPVWMPEGVDSKAFIHALKKTCGITVAGGQDAYKGKIFRLSHLGYYDELDMVALIAGIELALAEVDYPFEPGVGVAAVQRSLVENLRQIKAQTGELKGTRSL